MRGEGGGVFFFFGEGEGGRGWRGVFFWCCQVQLSVPAMQVTSSHVSIWFDFLASYDEYTALVKFGNVASEHVKSAISVVQPQLSAAQQKPSAVQQNRVGALVTHHPAWMSHHTSGSRQGHPRYNRCPTVGRPWVARSGDQPISSSSSHEMQKLFNRVMSPRHATRRTTRSMSTNDR